jgi:hypothetical protein
MREMTIMKTCPFSVQIFAPELEPHLQAGVVSGKTLPKPYVAAGSGCGDFSPARVPRWRATTVGDVCSLKKQRDDEVA